MSKPAVFQANSRLVLVPVTVTGNYGSNKVLRAVLRNAERISHAAAYVQHDGNRAWQVLVGKRQNLLWSPIVQDVEVLGVKSEDRLDPVTRTTNSCC